MSELPEERRSNHPTTVTGTLQLTIRARETVGEITANSTNSNTRNHASPVRPLGGDTPSDSHSYDSSDRGTVGDTTVTPKSQMELQFKSLMVFVAASYILQAHYKKEKKFF